MIDKFYQVITLAFVDSINPCEMGILLLMLVAISRTYKNKNAILSFGLAFILAMFFGYFLVGYLMIEVFTKFSQFLQARQLINQILAFIAITIGLIDLLSLKFKQLEIKMPKKFQQNVKNLIASLTSPIGAVFLALFSLVFLTPCTMGPYVVACGILANCPIYEVIPLLILYNFIFVLPLLIILLIVYFGISKAEKILKKRKKFENYMKIVTGLLLIIIGITLFLQFS